MAAVHMNIDVIRIWTLIGACCVCERSHYETDI